MRVDASDDREYVKLARALQRFIIAGKLPVGDWLPSVRVMSRETKLAANTVRAAYDLLIEKGIVAAMSTKGYVVKARPTAVEAAETEVRSFRDEMVVRGYPTTDVRTAFTHVLKETW